MPRALIAIALLLLTLATACSSMASGGVPTPERMTVTLPTPTLPTIGEDEPAELTAPPPLAEAATGPGAAAPPAPPPPPIEEQTPAETALLPDLLTLPPTNVRLVIDWNTGRSYLRFTTAIANAGMSDLELLGYRSPVSGKTLVLQRVRTTSGNQYGNMVGEFAFHPEHNHWHFGSFASYTVWSLQEDGSLNQILATSGKISYCLRDDEVLAEAVGRARTWPAYNACNGEVQGISAGWVDVYRSYLPGQYVEITGLEDGIYALVSTADPEGLLLESDETNNTAIIYFELSGNWVELLSAPPIEIPATPY